MFRSKTLKYYKICFPEANKKEIISNFGKFNFIQFEDLNKSQNLNNSNEYKALRKNEEYLQKLHFLEDILKEFDIKQLDIEDNHNFNNKLIYQLKNENINNYLHNIEMDLTNIFNKIKNYQQFINEIEVKIIDLNNKIKFFSTLQANFINKDMEYNIENNKIEVISGLISNNEINRFLRIIFRIGRGNIITTTYPINLNEEDFSDIKNSSFFKKNKNLIEQSYSLIILTFSTSEIKHLKNKINMLCESFKIFLYSFKQAYDFELLNSIKNDFFESKNLLNETYIKIIECLNNLNSSINFEFSYINEIKYSLLKNQLILKEINKFEIRSSVMHGKFWIPLEKNDILENNIIPDMKLKKEYEGIYTKIIENSNEDNFPTLLLDNDFCYPFQEIVNTYSIPKYKEANPGFFTIITFPFLFGVMFGDIFHGLILLLLTYVLFNNEQRFNKINTSIFRSRYLFLLMGLFSLYNGLIYNDFISIFSDLFGSCYIVNNDKVNIKYKKCVYPFGIDPIWSEKSNEISYSNSYKMKISIIYGVIHMILGINIKGMNCIYFKDYISLFFEYIPQILFMLSSFGYMVFCIIVKWFNDYSSNTQIAPSIIEVFINLIFPPIEPLYLTKDIQNKVQLILFSIILITIPWMLFPKPIINHYFKKKKKSYNKVEILNKEDEIMQLMDDLEDNNNSENIEEHKEEPFIEVFIHQLIETIEFVLASISNTASYLRLWALSLAHSQLSKVFFDMIFSDNYLNTSNVYLGIIYTFIGFLNLLWINFFVFICMDLMECFLHTLRLHWVEFQNKFYKGEGLLFSSINFDKYFNENKNKYLNVNIN